MLQPRNVAFLLALFIGLVADQATKWWIVQNVAYEADEIHLIPGLLSIVHARNEGAAFSVLEGQHSLFLVFTVIAVVVVLDMLRRLPGHAAFLAGSLGLLLSGALGNAIDRLRFRYVTDFIRVYTDAPALKSWLIETFGTNTWPIFNVADSALLVGVAAYLMHGLFAGEQAELEAMSEAVSD